MIYLTSRFLRYLTCCNNKLFAGWMFAGAKLSDPGALSLCTCHGGVLCLVNCTISRADFQQVNLSLFSSRFMDTWAALSVLKPSMPLVFTAGHIDPKDAATSP